MILVFAIASTDRNHAKHQLRLLRQFGPYMEDKILVVPTPSAYHDPMIRPVVDGLMELSSPENCRVEVGWNDFGGGWPAGPNQHFRFAVEKLEEIGWDGEPFIWMEPDLMPIQAGWLSKVKQDYVLAATPFRGMLEKTRFIDTDPRTKVETPRYNGMSHLVGAGIYPANYIKYRTPNGSPMASYRNTNGSLPFDVRCEAQHVPATQSPLWLHRFRTIDWRHVGGSTYTCNDQTIDKFGLTYAGPVSLAGVCLVHGCKDGSLADAILNSQPLPAEVPQARLHIPPVESAPAMADSQFISTLAPSSPPPQPVVTDVPSDMERLVAENQSLQEQIEDIRVTVETFQRASLNKSQECDALRDQIKEKDELIVGLSTQLEELQNTLKSFTEDVKQNKVQSTESPTPKRGRPAKNVTPPKKVAKKPKAA